LTTEHIPGFTFPRALRLCKKKQFDRAFKEGRPVRNRLFLLICAPNGLPHSRMGLMVGRKYGNAVKRNRLKRLCREAFRLHRRELPQGLDFVVLPKGQSSEYTLASVADSFQRLLGHAQARMGK
jgi:ribonuclease P protein component